MNRQPAVAGIFYPQSPVELRKTVAQLMPTAESREAAFGVVLPHAGYVYSGPIAGQVLAGVKVPRQVVILGPNHHGLGASAALYGHGAWETPLGAVPIAENLARRLLTASDLLAEDTLAHRREHSLEVQVPFLQQANPEVEIVPICLGHGRMEDWVQLGEDLGRVLAGEEPTLIVASTDMSHYVSEEMAQQADQRALEQILAMNPEGLYETVRSNRISMCGFVPVTVLLAAARAHGGLQTKLVRYGTSGDVTGDRTQVVGYAGLVVA